MKHLMIGAVALALLAAPTAHAEEGTSATADVSVEAKASTTLPRPVKFLENIKARLDAREDVRDAREDKRDAATTTGPRDAREDRRDAVEDRIDAKTTGLVGLKIGVATRVKAEVSRFGILLGATIERLETLIDRLNRAAVDLEAKGVAVAEGKAHLSVAAAELVAAKTALGEIRVAGSVAVDASAETTTTIREKFKAAHEKMQEAREHIRKAYTEIKAAIASFRASAKASASAEVEAGE